MRYHLYQKSFGKMVEIKEMSYLSTRGMGLMFGNCICKVPREYQIVEVYIYAKCVNKKRSYTVHMMLYSEDLFYSIFSGLFGVYHFMVLIKPH